jgi:hypothetical protein
MNNKLSLIILFSTILTSNENYLGKLKYSKESSSLFSYDKSKLPFDPKPYECSQLINPQNIKLIHNLNVSLQIEYDNFLHLKILDADNNNRWIVPENEVLNPKYIFNRISNIKNSPSKFKIKIPSNNKLSFSILTPNDEEIYSFSEEKFGKPIKPSELMIILNHNYSFERKTNDITFEIKYNSFDPERDRNKNEKFLKPKNEDFNLLNEYSKKNSDVIKNVDLTPQLKKGIIFPPQYFDFFLINEEKKKIK